MIGSIREIDFQQLIALLAGLRARRIGSIHVHHTWRPSHSDWRGQATIEAIRRYHVNELHWSDIAQHLTIGPDGSLWTGRDLDRPPASAVGHNGSLQEGPLMIEIIGDFDRGRDVFEGAQTEATYAAVAAMCTAFSLPPDAVRFHNEFNPAKTCPGTSLVLADFRAEVKKQLSALARRASVKPVDAASARAYVAQFGRKAVVEPARMLGESESAEPRYDAAQALYDWRGEPAGRFLGKCECSDGEREIFRSHVVDLAMGQLSKDGCYNNVESDLDELVARIGAWVANAPHPRLMFFAHGGLVDERDGLGIAVRDHSWWLANGIYPVFFVWETGFLEVFKQKQRELAARNIITDASDALLEVTLGPTAGKPTWDRIKDSALLSSAAVTGTGFPGGAHLFGTKLAAWLRTYATTPGAKRVGLNAVGHSAGAIFHCHFLPAFSAALAAVGAPNGKFDTLAFLAPAVRIDLFKSRLMPLIPGSIQKFALFTMSRASELDDNVATVYRKSLLYFVRNACETPVHASPILGLEESIRTDPDLPAWLGLTGSAPAAGVDVAWSPTMEISGPSATRSRTHGGFDNDAPTMNAVLYRILALPSSTPLPQPHLGETEVSVCGQMMRGFGQPQSRGDVPTARETARTGRRRALTIGINAYPTQPLAGCVADARSAGALLSQLGFDVSSLFDGEATRRGIETAIDRLLAESAPGDIVVIHYAGHGTQVPDLNQDEGDGFDEAWVPVDYMSGEFFIDDDVGALFDRYHDRDIELVVFTDCCHSGTTTRAAFTRDAPQLRANSRYLKPPADAIRRFRELRGKETPATKRAASSDGLGWEIHYAACRDTQSAYEHDGQGDFTRALMRTLQSAVSTGASYEALGATLASEFASNTLQSPGFRAQEAVRARALFGEDVRATVVPVKAGPGTAASLRPESRDLVRRIDDIDAKLDALTRKIDAL